MAGMMLSGVYYRAMWGCITSRVGVYYRAVWGGVTSCGVVCYRAVRECIIELCVGVLRAVCGYVMSCVWGCVLQSHVGVCYRAVGWYVELNCGVLYCKFL